MKPFDLKKALAGEPVVLRDGHKAIVYYCVPDEIKLDDEGTPVSFPLKGMKFDQDGYLINSSVEWHKDGRFRCSESDSDIVGMWEEPELTSEQVLEKAYQENLPLDAIGKKAFVIAKTKDGDYVMQCGEDNLYFASHKIEWEFYKDPAPKSDTITVTLPKSFKPKDGESYFYINGGNIDYEHEFLDTNNFDITAAERGNCFRTKEDAQKWLDFMKGMME